MSAPVAVITGAAGGIGSATVDSFRQKGWDVIGIDLSEGAGSTASRWLIVDLADGEAIRDAFDELKDVGRISALVNNAATMLSTQLGDTSTQEWDEVLAVNLRAAFLTMRSALPFMGTGDAIVNVSSVHAFATSGDVAAYAAAKAGLIGLTRASALSLAGRGIRVNAVVPGAVDTEMLHGSTGDSSRVEAIVDRTPLGRIGKPGEIAEAILFLSDQRRSSFITGQTLVVDGGALARLSTE